jgi:hypothetical protein
LGGGAFILLKSGPTGPESAKQAEIRLAIFLKILQDRSPAPESCGHLGMVKRFLPDMANLP